MSFLDIARNPLLARAARAELHAGNPEAAAASASAAAGVPLPEAEVAPLPAVHLFAQASMCARDVLCHGRPVCMPELLTPWSMAKEGCHSDRSSVHLRSARQKQLICMGSSWTRHGAQAALGPRVAESLDGEAAEESRSGRELAALLAARLDAARRASEKLLGVLQVGLPGRPSLGSAEHMEGLHVDVRCKGNSNAACPLCCLTCSPDCDRDILLLVRKRVGRRRWRGRRRRTRAR